MNEIFIVHTIKEDLSNNEEVVFFSKSLAQLYAWNYYMEHCFYAEDAYEDWKSLLLDNEIYCDIENIGKVKSIWITYHKVVEGIEPKITFMIDTNIKKPEN